jgi:hypothetical protein
MPKSKSRTERGLTGIAEGGCFTPPCDYSLQKHTRADSPRATEFRADCQ